MHRVVIASTLLVTMTLIGPAPPAAAGRRSTYVTDTCTRVRMRPEAIVFACGDGNFYVDQLQWRSWHTWRAAGRGVFHINDCKPDCADGTFHVRRGRIRLASRIRCDGIDKFVFDRARIAYDRAWHHTRRFGVRHIGCPIH
jgi:hypothetical protein